MFQYKTKMDYAKKYPRADVHTTIRDDKYTDFLILSKKCKQPATKILDLLIIELLENKKFQQEILNKVKNY